MKCANCGGKLNPKYQPSFNAAGKPVHPFCCSGTKRSGAAQRCLPSTTGSASAASNVKKHDLFYQCEDGKQLPIGETEDGPGVDNSVVQLPVSDSVLA